MYVVCIKEEGKKDRFLLRDHNYTQHRTTSNIHRAALYSESNANKIALAIANHFQGCDISAISNGEENS